MFTTIRLLLCSTGLNTTYIVLNVYKQKTPTTREVVGGNIEIGLGRPLSNCSLREASELAPGFSAIQKLRFMLLSKVQLSGLSKVIRRVVQEKTPIQMPVFFIENSQS